MTERSLAAEAKEPEAVDGRAATGVPSEGAMAATVLRLQRTAGNAAVGGLISPVHVGLARIPAVSVQRCSAGGCSCGGACGRHRELDDEEELAVSALALRRAVVARRTLARQHTPGGPYHPPPGTEMSCSMADDCSTLSTKINYLRHTIKRHQEWDIANPDPRYPGGRHAAEIADLQRALQNCTQIAGVKCTGQPVWVPVPETRESPEERAERVKRQLYEALPYALAVVVIGLVIACVIAEPCGAAVAAALAAVLGEEALALVLAILAGNGVRVVTP